MTAVGFTGTRKGLTNPQVITLGAVLSRLLPRLCPPRQTREQTIEFHDGDCTGADAQAAAIAALLGYTIITHPPTASGLRAYHPAHETRPAKPYLERDRAIVNTTAVLIGCPDGPARPHSGTWYTINYARELFCPTVVIMPDGVIV